MGRTSHNQPEAKLTAFNFVPRPKKILFPEDGVNKRAERQKGESERGREKRRKGLWGRVDGGGGGHKRLQALITREETMV